jgi:hypothetical protein
MLGSLAPILAQDEAAPELFAEVLAEVLAECRERGRMAWYGPALGAVARVQAHLGRMVEARAAAEQALARLRRGRRRTEARLPLGAALETFEQLGAAPWAERARQELAESGEGGKPAGEGVVSRTNSPAHAAALSVLASQ